MKVKPVVQKPRVYTDLDALAGCWSKAEAAGFAAALAPFAGFDRVLWSPRPRAAQRSKRRRTRRG